MEKVVVAIANIEQIDQLLCLPKRYEHQGKEWVITYPSDITPIFSVVDNKFDFAHDMLIQPRWNQLGLHPFDSRKRIWFLDRYDKVNQNVNLENVIAHFGTKHYKRLAVSSIEFNLPKVTYNFDDSKGGYIIKPTGGARSLGIMLIDEPINLRELLTLMKPMLANKKTTNDDYIKLWDSFGIRYYIGTERKPNEMAEVLADNTLVIQEMNPYGGVVEFRVISGCEKPLMFKRNHLTTEKVNIIDEIVVDDTLISKEVYEDIMMVMSSGKLQTYGSHDIWYSASAGCWGIYEYQTQYGHNHIPSQQHIEYLKDVLAVAYARLTGEMVFNSVN